MKQISLHYKPAFEDAQLTGRVRTRLSSIQAGLKKLTGMDLIGRMNLSGVVGHEGSTVLVVLNGLRLLAFRQK